MMKAIHRESGLSCTMIFEPRPTLGCAVFGICHNGERIETQCDGAAMIQAEKAYRDRDVDVFIGLLNSQPTERTTP